MSGGSLLDRVELVAASQDELMADLQPVQKLDERSRLRASPVTAGGRNLIVVVGAALDDRNDSVAACGICC